MDDEVNQNHAEGFAEHLRKHIVPARTAPMLKALEDPAVAAFLGSYVDHQIKNGVNAYKASRSFQ